MRLFFVLVAAATLLLAADAKFGKPLTLDKATPIAAILAKPGDYAGKTVQVKGKITDICKEMGCWLEIADENDKRIRFNSHDTIFFPKDSAGRTVVAEGKVVKGDKPSIDAAGAVILEK